MPDLHSVRVGREGGRSALVTDSNSAAAGDLVVFPPRKKLLLPILGCAVFVAISIEMVTSPTTTFHFQSKGVVVGVGWIGLLFFGLGGLTLVARAVSPRPTLLLDQRGLTNRTNRASIPFIPWSEIVGTTNGSVGGKDVLVVQVADPERLLATCKSPLRRALIEKSFQGGYGVSSILGIAVPGSLRDLQQRIEVLAKRP
jgi:hypothetical protein